MGVIKLSNVYKTFDMVTTTKDKLTMLLSPKKNSKKFLALNDVTLTIKPGEVVGLLGINGSGKSTLSNIISGILFPSSGVISVDGDVAIIAVSQGLKSVLTGRENIRLKCLMLGMTEQEIDNRIEDIIDFADIGDFIDQPIKKYSSGMKSRLGFAIAINTDADILVIDEALSVGDQTFYSKCIDQMNIFKEEGKTIIFVSHNLSQVESFCERVIWLEYGKIINDGPVTDVLKKYKLFLDQYKSMSIDEQRKYSQAKKEKHTEILKQKVKSENSFKLIDSIFPMTLLVLTIILGSWVV
ncbi:MULTISPECIES: ABC transporter ATP-binding protein [unclassified Exiguobacterium]|uniref:ABC transporter ATP-binding protein n=1 Tax=unclassified Exiguobacterium TaxID=2644629 RepID=UPI001BE533E2|nr:MULTISPECIES: ABC transporter ATP-binding protein [unclassified Exiguobacterium]